MFKIKVNNRFVHEIEATPKSLSLDGQIVPVDLSQVGNQTWSLIYENQSFNAEIVELNRADKTCKIKINGSVYSIAVEDQFDLLLKQMGLDRGVGAKVLEIKAPMPGLVLNILISEDAEVKKGDNLFVLEAMKMENMIKSSSDGMVKKILVKQGDKVEKNQVLIQFK